MEVSREGTAHVKGVTDQCVVMQLGWIWWDAGGKGKEGKKTKNISWVSW